MTTGNYLIKCPTLNKRKRDNFTFHCSLILLFSSQGIQYRGNRGENIGAFFLFCFTARDKWYKVKYPEKMEEEQFCFIQNAD